MQILVLALAAAVLFQFIRILGDVRAMTDRARRGTDVLAGDLTQLRTKIREESRDTWSGVKMLARSLLRRTGLADDAGVRD